MKKTELPRKKFTTTLNPDLAEQLKIIAIKKKCSVADIIEQLVSDFIDRESRRS